jgi:hypothetical protein
VRRQSCPRVSLAAAFILSGFAASPSKSQTIQAMPPFEAHVDMKTFMEHVLTPAAKVIWSVNGSVIDAKGEHSLSPSTDDDWENITSGAATLAEATNALMIPQRVQDAEWNAYVKKLADAANKAYQAAEVHDLKTVADVSDQLDGICASCLRHYGLE